MVVGVGQSLLYSAILTQPILPTFGMLLEFVERDCERTQEFAILVATQSAPKPTEVIRQRWNFSPQGSTKEVEEYEVDFTGVNVLELQITPDVSGGPSRATLSGWRVA